MKKHVLWMPMTAILLGSCSSSTPLPPHLKFDEAVSKYGTPTHVDHTSDGGSIAFFQRKAETGASIDNYALTFDAGGQCIGSKVEMKTDKSGGPSEDLDEATRLRNICYSHTYDVH